MVRGEHNRLVDSVAVPLQVGIILRLKVDHWEVREQEHELARIVKLHVDVIVLDHAHVIVVQSVDREYFAEEVLQTCQHEIIEAVERIVVLN